jgi:hypothetical protein
MQLQLLVADNKEWLFLSDRATRRRNRLTRVLFTGGDQGLPLRMGLVAESPRPSKGLLIVQDHQRDLTKLARNVSV